MSTVKDEVKAKSKTRSSKIKRPPVKFRKKPKVVAQVLCGRALHRIALIGNSLVLLDHSQDREETDAIEAIAALAEKPTRFNKCQNVLECWRKYHKERKAMQLLPEPLAKFRDKCKPSLVIIERKPYGRRRSYYDYVKVEQKPPIRYRPYVEETNRNVRRLETIQKVVDKIAVEMAGTVGEIMSKIDVTKTTKWTVSFTHVDSQAINETYCAMPKDDQNVTYDHDDSDKRIITYAGLNVHVDIERWLVRVYRQFPSPFIGDYLLLTASKPRPDADFYVGLAANLPDLFKIGGRSYYFGRKKESAVIVVVRQHNGIWLIDAVPNMPLTN